MAERKFVNHDSELIYGIHKKSGSKKPRLTEPEKEILSKYKLRIAHRQLEFLDSTIVVYTVNYHEYHDPETGCFYRKDTDPYLVDWADHCRKHYERSYARSVLPLYDENCDRIDIDFVAAESEILRRETEWRYRTLAESIRNLKREREQLASLSYCHEHVESYLERELDHLRQKLDNAGSDYDLHRAELEKACKESKAEIDRILKRKG